MLAIAVACTSNLDLRSPALSAKNLSRHFKMDILKQKQLKAIVQPIPNDPKALYHAKTNFISLVLAKLLLPSAGDFACAKAVKISPCKCVRKDERE